MNERTRFNYVKNRDKAFANLISIIDGILSDGTLDQKEILYLDTWLLDGLAPIFPYTFYHLTHDWFVAADIPV
ncbi:hypothetical protein RZP77_29330, partial [Klebsiella grimontii]|nr:hypothetical protein [Klebsiella grimontii]MDV1026946.1 hypothetical protein [Klebsiella grimontii]MDV1043510.1 hypothetical protein [Klebsiella grimontii]MDV1107984.1 hypothetical protein [Klebsiella grimontii]MDV1118341.1 hypothetical protein [Klebsiella grimontii]